MKQFIGEPSEMTILEYIELKDLSPKKRPRFSKINYKRFKCKDCEHIFCYMFYRCPFCLSSKGSMPINRGE